MHPAARACCITCRGLSASESRIPKPCSPNPRSGSVAGRMAGGAQGAAKPTKCAVEGSAVSSTSSSRSGSKGRKRPASAPKKPKKDLEQGWVDVVEPPPEAEKEEAALPTPEVAGENPGAHACVLLLLLPSPQLAGKIEVMLTLSACMADEALQHGGTQNRQLIPAAMHTGEALALAASMAGLSQDGDAPARAEDAAQPGARLTAECDTEAAQPCTTDAKSEQPVTAALHADSTHRVDAATQVTPKINSGVPAVLHEAPQPKGCACCTIM